MTTQRTHASHEEYLTPKEAARRLHVHTRTLVRMSKRGDIRTNMLPSGHRRYNAADVDALANGGRPALADEPAAPKAVSA